MEVFSFFFLFSLAVGDAFTRLDGVVLVLRLGVGMVASLLYMSACVLLQLFASLFGRVFACVIPPYSVQGAAFRRHVWGRSEFVRMMI